MVLTKDAEAAFRNRLRYEKRKAAARDHDYLRRHGYFEMDSTNEQLDLRVQLLSRARAQRAEGLRLDTTDALFTEAVRRELERRGIDPGEPPSYPAGARASGRWPGVRNGHYKEAITATVPTEYALAVTAAAWAISGPTVTLLRERFPKGRPTYRGPRLEEYFGLARKVVTAGDIYRRAVHRISSYPGSRQRGTAGAESTG